jgi:hypothetical protein
MKAIKFILPLCLCANFLYAKDIKEPSVLFQKKCQMCHMIGVSKDKKVINAMVSPSINYTIKNLVWGMDSENDGISDSELKKISVAFMKDYLYYPDRKKTNCEDISFDRFGVMPSLKGFISEEEMDVLLPWVYDKFKPTKQKDGSWMLKE